MPLESNPTTPRSELGNKSYYDIIGGRFNFKRYVEAVNGKILPGFQLRYMYFIDKSYRKRLIIQEIPFSKIDEMGAGIYKGGNIARNKTCYKNKR